MNNCIYILYIYRGYQMRVSSVSTEFIERVDKKYIMRASDIILFYSTSSINLLMNLHEFMW